MSVFIEIKSCGECPHGSHTGAFTKGGAKPCCDHKGTVALKGDDCFKRVIPHRGHTKKVKGIPDWCPLRKKEKFDGTKPKPITPKTITPLPGPSIPIQSICNCRGNETGRHTCSRVGGIG